ncbi:hydroxymethylbilane synthase [Corynebacterium sp. HS2168-gen11]|uniref:hydroxymethylbilane synthase n=1 Tax=Corynebacterium sp. HS2168-gen11 TaxID=2974027 RepID=UPI00216B3D16|nr:hydroxymethylbilane synthase [Corynebacterium sp. HS2168-gen11]MCS4535769.1 hydroxymethylbilane synthase [Corynebacterium sp. HS2168-gen11]
MFRIGTRGSLLATTQTGHVRDALAAHGYDSELRIITTVGDVNMAPVERIGVGVFTQALRDALANGECDIAVHSLKDLPTTPDERFYMVMPERVDARDCLIARDGLTLAQLPPHAKVGTGAPRRISQIKKLRPDIETVPLRGNIDTRMKKVSAGELDAVILAYAGLLRVEKADCATEVLEPAQVLPAPAQGILAVECRADDEAAKRAIMSIADAWSTACAIAERVVLRTLEAGCTAPVAAYATVGAGAGVGSVGAAGALTLVGSITSLDGTLQLTASATGVDPVAVGEEVAAKLFAQGAGLMLD